MFLLQLSPSLENILIMSADSLTSVKVEIRSLWEVPLIQFNMADIDVGYRIVSIRQMCGGCSFLLQATVLCLDFCGSLLLKQHTSQFTSTLCVTVLHTIKCLDEGET